MKKLLSLITIAALVLALMSGCSGSQDGETAQPSQSPQPTAEETAESAPAVEEAEPVQQPEEEDAAPVENQLPLTDEPASFSYFIEQCDQYGDYLTAWADNVAYKQAEALTGISVDFQEQPVQSFTEKFNLMVASEDYTDFLKKVDTMYAGGVAVAVSDEVIIDLSPWVNTVMPNYLAAMDIDPTAYLGAFNEDGSAYTVISILSEVVNERGLFVRQDWLDELGLDVPETYDQLHDVLVAFKNAYDCQYTYYLSADLQEICLSGGLGTIGFKISDRESATHYYHNEGVVTSALIEDSFRDYLELLNQYYTEGLLDPDFYTAELSPPQLQAICYGGASGVFTTEANFLSQMYSQAEDPDFQLTPLKDIVVNEGDRSGFATPQCYSSGGEPISISSNCQDPELACKYLDFWYSDKGVELANYGLVDESFVYNDDGSISYTDMVLDNPDGMPARIAKGYYICNSFVSKSIKSVSFLDYDEKQLEAVEVFSTCADDLHQIPELVTLNAEESEVENRYLTDCETYAKEMVMGFLTGSVSFDRWDEYVAQLKELGIEDCIAVRQTAYDRYISRLSEM